MFWKSSCDTVLIWILSPDFFSKADTIAAIAFFGTGSDALEPNVADLELLPPPLLPPVQAANSGRPATPAAPTAAPFRRVRRLGPAEGTGVGTGIQGLLGGMTLLTGVEKHP